MVKFYKTAALALVCLVLSSGLLLYLGVSKAQRLTRILPVQNNALPWKPRLVAGVSDSETTSLSVNEDTELLDFNYWLSPDVLYPYASYSMDFGDIGVPSDLRDWSGYDSVSFAVRCSPQNVLLFVLFTWDDEVTVPMRHHTYRVSSAFFPCGDHWNTVEVQFADLDTPDWWLEKFNLPLTQDKDMRLDKVFGLGFVNSLQSLRQTDSNVKIADLQLAGYNPRFIYFAVAAIALLWLVCGVWLFRCYTTALVNLVRDNVKRDLPLVAYQKLTVEPRSGKEKADVISFMAAQYANPDLDLETAVNSLGINRNKINEILKSELGLTFSGYLNKLRLTEAARLLLEQQDINVGQIAFAVGYNNVTYFNKLFKNQYGCTPKKFKTLYQSPPENRNE